MKQVSDKAASLAQKITDARTSLMLLRQRHPQPRLTIPLAENKLADQVTEMQTLNDEVQAIKQQNKAEKERVKSLALEVENTRTEATEAQKAVNMLHLEEDDSRLLPLYDWFVSRRLAISFHTEHRLLVFFRFITSRELQQSLCNIEESYSASENEHRLTYKIDRPPNAPHHILITLIYAPDTRRLAAVQTSGLDEIGVEVGDLVDTYVSVNDVHSLVTAILARARTVVSL